MMATTVHLPTFAAVLATAIFSAGCPAHIQPRPQDGPESPDEVRSLVEAFVVSGPQVAIIEARASQYSDSGAMKGKLEIIVDRARGFRMSGLTPTDDVVSTVACNQERFAAFERGQKVCHAGQACAGNVGRFTGLPMLAGELAGVLLGRPPLLGPRTSTMRLDWDGKRGAWELTVIDGAREQTVWLADTDRRIVRTRVIDGGRLVADVKYSEFKRIAGAPVPHRIDMRLARDDTDLRIDVRNLDVEATIDPGAFVFSCPPGIIVDELPCE